MNEKIIIDLVGEFFIKNISNITEISEFDVDGNMYEKFTIVYNNKEYMFSDFDCYDLRCYEMGTSYSIVSQNIEQLRIRFIRWTEYFNKG